MRSFDHRSGTTLTIDGAAIYHESIGDPAAPALLLLHGGLKDLADFDAVLPRLEGSFHVVGIDSRGHGRSTAGPGALTYRRLEDDALAIADHVGLDRFSVIGFSDGGIVGLRLAARPDARVDRLVTVGSRWTPPADPTRAELAATSPESWQRQFPDAYARYRDLNRVPDAGALTRALVAMWFDPSASGHPEQSVRSIAADLLIARGDDDPLTTVESCIALQRHVPRARFLNVPFADHAAFADQPDIFMRTCNRFLAGR